MAVVSAMRAEGAAAPHPVPGQAPLAEWLSWQETLHGEAIDLGLERCLEVASRMRLLPLPFPVVTLAGTNGKGATAALLEAMLTSAGYRTGVYASPYVMRFNECVRIGAAPAADDALIDAFLAVESARGGTTLTAFEFQTLAAAEHMRRAGVDIALLEAGLGGRRDAVNVFDPVVAVLTTLAVDHTRWLGSDRAAIAREKCGIFRPRRPAVCGDPAPPPTVAKVAGALDVCLRVQGRDFQHRVGRRGWRWWHADAELSDLPPPSMNGRCQYHNAATALMVLHELRDRFTVPGEAVARGLRRARLPARQEVRRGPVERIIDVAHNVEAVAALADTLRARPARGRTLAVFSMLGDKDLRGCTAALAGVVDAWYIGGIDAPRGLSASNVARRAGLQPARDRVELHPDVRGAYRRAMDCATAGDRVVVFGSFHTARAVLGLDANADRAP